MSRDNAERRAPLTLVEPPDRRAGQESAEAGDLESLRRPELNLRALAEELGEALVHLERASLASKGTGFTGRVRDAVDEVDKIQRAASE
ncbi:MAG: hypothetical protein MJB57_04760, partial [Gemmatimonadetes bacterium]|nr:hypothetical protein [Gemmatimonadota bacterium]